jgi:hypothetical protein
LPGCHPEGSVTFVGGRDLGDSSLNKLHSGGSDMLFRECHFATELGFLLKLVADFELFPTRSYLRDYQREALRNEAKRRADQTKAIQKAV